MTSSSPTQIFPPDIIHGVPQKTCPLQSSKFNFIPNRTSTSSSPSASSTYIPKSSSSASFKINPSVLSRQSQHKISSGDSSPGCSQQGTNKRSMLSKRKTDFDDSFTIHETNERLSEPQRKVHLNEELVAQTMSELYISHPRPKVARRNFGKDVAEAINLSSMEDLESKFSHQAAITNMEDYSLPPQRTRKLPNRSKLPQLRVSLHQELRNLRTPSSLLPESILSKYRPAPRTGTTAVVLWKPPGGTMPDIISSALRSGPGNCSGYTTAPVSSRSRIRCYSEVTSTPYSSHENLSSVTCPGLGEDVVDTCADMATASSSMSPGHSRTSPSAEAPELSSSFLGEIDGEIPLGVNIHRRNSAPEINESLPFNDESSMEL